MARFEDDADDGLSPSLLKGIRARVALNHFKREVLGHLHVPGKAQASALFEALERGAMKIAPKDLSSHAEFRSLGWLGMRLGTRGWQGWFGADARVPRPGKQLALDTVAEHLIQWSRPADDAALALPNDFYSSLISGGLLPTMLAETEAAGPSSDLLRARARAYRPKSAWHLHLDALELRAFCGDFPGASWVEIVQIAGGRILDALNRLWRPIDGQIYAMLSSDTRRQWTASSSEERARIQAEFARLRPDQFASSMIAGARPSWSLTGVGVDMPDVHVHRLLFALGADADFLHGDRLCAWALDLATAGLAARALAWTDRYRKLGRQVSEELLYLAAIDSLLLSGVSAEAAASEDSEAVHLEEVDRELQAAMACTGGDWSRAGVSALYRGRAAYLAELADLDLSIEEVEHLSRRAQTRQPLVFVGDTPARDPAATPPTLGHRHGLWGQLGEASYRRQGLGDVPYFGELPPDPSEASSS